MAETTSTVASKEHWGVPFFSIWIGQALSLVGSGVAGFALVWWLTDSTGSATVLAFATLVQLLPSVFLGPFAGALVDRWNRRRVMLIADSIVAVFSAWLAYLFWADALQIWHVYLIMFIRSLGGTFHWSAMQASTSLMVPKEQLSRVSGMNQTLFGVLNIASPPLGAFLMSVLPLHFIMLIDVITAGFAIGPLLFVQVPQPVRAEADAGLHPSQISIWHDVREGFRYIVHWRGMLIVLLVATIINLLVNPAMSLLPIMVTRYFGQGAVQLGWLNSAWGAGVVLGGLTLSAWGGFRRRIITSLLGLLGMSVGFVIVGMAPATAFWMAWGGLLLAGVMNPIVNGPFFAIMQDVVTPDMQGRVFTVVGSISGAAAPLGMLIAGPISDALGVQLWFIVAGVIGLGMGIAMPFVQPVMHLEDQHKPTQAQVSTAEPLAG